ncbi:MAG: hypothetical protein Q9M15_03875 [Mariprofundaceae bacterium]|nr:hypothetical protein [Mariprofundaceae bacterium]
MQQFEPIGRANPAISWLIQDVHVSERKDLKGGVMQLTLSDGQYYLSAIVLGGSVFSANLQLGMMISVVGQLKPDDWKGDDAIQFEVDDVWVNEVVLTA